MENDGFLIKMEQNALLHDYSNSEKSAERGEKATYDALKSMKPKLFKKLAQGQTTLNERDNQHARTQSARDNPISTRGPNQHATIQTGARENC